MNVITQGTTKNIIENLKRYKEIFKNKKPIFVNDISKEIEKKNKYKIK